MWLLAHLSPSAGDLPLDMAAGFPRAIDLGERAQDGHPSLFVILEVRSHHFCHIL